MRLANCTVSSNMYPVSNRCSGKLNVDTQIHLNYCAASAPEAINRAYYPPSQLSSDLLAGPWFIQASADQLPLLASGGMQLEMVIHVLSNHRRPQLPDWNSFHICKTRQELQAIPTPPIALLPRPYSVFHSRRDQMVRFQLSRSSIVRDWQRLR